MSGSVCIVLIGACKPPIKYIPVTTTEQEIITLHDTIIRFQPVIYRDSIVTRDTVSLLTNEYATSYASWTGKELSHSLNINNREIPVRLQYIEKEKRVEIPAPYPVEVIKYQDKTLTLWQRIRIGMGNLFLWLFPLFCGWKLKKRW